MSVLSMREQDKMWAASVLKSRLRLMRIYEAMKAGDPEAYESMRYLTHCFNKYGYPCATEDGSDMVTAAERVADAEAMVKRAYETGDYSAVLDAIEKLSEPHKSQALAALKVLSATSTRRTETN